ncbi:hypothetical protein MMC07_007657 [Pseudocyphellaria aurata]|nr:hypothetical protein [Pseudocyphellaria aurata]
MAQNSRGNSQRSGGRGGRGGRGERDRNPQPQDKSFCPENHPPPSAIVQHQEDENVKAYAELDLTGLSLVDQTLPLRPGYGTRGQNIILRTNYFSLYPDEKAELYRYSIDISPTAASRKRRQIIALFLATPTFDNLRPGLATDYSTIIVTASRLDLNTIGVLEESVLYCNEHESTPRPHAARYTVKLSQIREAKVTDLLKFLSLPPSRNVSQFESMAETISAMNLAVTQAPNESPTTVSDSRDRKFFPLRYGSERLDDDLIAIQGYYSSVRGCTSRMLVNVNVCLSAFYRSGKLSGLLSRKWRSPEFLKGLRVTTTYLTDDNMAMLPREYTIQRLAPGSGRDRPGNAENTVFPWAQSGSLGEISVEDYFFQKYGIELENPKLPLVDVGTRDNPKYLPPDLCDIVKGQRYRKKLTAVQTTAMITAAVKLSTTNAEDISNIGMEVIGIRPRSPVLAAFGLTIDPKMITVPGRILSTPSLVYRNREQFMPRSASWNMRGQQFNKANNAINWSTLRLSLQPPNSHQESPQQINFFRDSLKTYGLNIGQSQNFTANISKDEDQNDKVIRAKLEQISRTPATILLVILPDDNKHTYSRIKFWADFRLGIHTVCSIAKKFYGHKDQAFYANIGLKFNLKMGGINQLIGEDHLGIVKEGKTMLVGIDITHPSPSSVQGAPSIAGVVASIDNKLAQWPGSIRAQESRKEMVSDLEDMMMERLRTWQKKNNNRLPDKILVYRDGVSESEYEKVLSQELPCLEKACEKVYPTNAKPKISVIIVGKRHHTRFFTVRDGEPDRNPVNGTIVDRGITMHHGWDFFLQAHKALKGTARPAHYVVICNRIGLGVDALETLTHNLCYLYGRATKAVSICPPAYYAHLICERGRCYLYRSMNGNSTETFDWDRAPWRSGVHAKLADSMFYI